MSRSTVKAAAAPAWRDALAGCARTRVVERYRYAEAEPSRFRLASVFDPRVWVRGGLEDITHQHHISIRASTHGSTRFSRRLSGHLFRLSSDQDLTSLGSKSDYDDIVDSARLGQSKCIASGDRVLHKVMNSNHCSFFITLSSYSFRFSCLPSSAY